MNTASWKNRLSAGWLRPVLCAVGAALFLLAAYILYFHRTDLWHLWLPASGNNDEVIYNRQLAGVLAGGQPAGVYGYNEGRAAVGHFGGWGPVLFFLYAIPGLVTGSGVNAMFWCNLLFAVAGWVLFACGTRLSARRQLLAAVALFVCWYPLQEVFSGTSEPLQFFLLLAGLGAASALQRRFQVGWFLVLAAACALTTVTRAYTVLLWLYPIVLLWKRHRRWALVSLAGAVLSVAGYLVVTVAMTAAFFTQNLDMQVFSLLAEGKPVQAVVYGCTKLGTQLAYLWREGIAPAARGDFRELGITSLLLLLLLVIQVVVLVRDALARRPVAFQVCTLAVVAVSLLGLLEMYEMYAMARHLIMLAFFLVAALACSHPRALAVCLVLVILLPYHWQTVTLPTYDGTMDAQLQTVSAALEQREEAQQSDDPWAHTLAYAFRDGVSHGYLYAVPGTMGIQFDQNTYLTDENNPIHSQYVMVGHGSEAEARLLADGWRELVSTEDLIVYERPETGA